MKKNTRVTKNGMAKSKKKKDKLKLSLPGCLEMPHIFNIEVVNNEK